MKNASIASAVAGFAAAALMFGLSSFQRHAPAEPVRMTWPPRPAQIVNWSAAEEFGLGSNPVPPDGDLVMVAVPSDRWLVITYHNSLGSFHLIERLGGIDTLKTYITSGVSPDFGGTSVGLAFRPGSEVVARNTSDTSTASFSDRTTFTGYYSR